ncbi:outer membrane lipoprotein chaperone LolA, partial [Escherichia coli]|nr:outer membrane lipoprotein chaperone LolA [Escherichia coli]
MKKIAITCALLSSLVASSVWADAASDLKSRLDKVSSFHASFTQKVTDGSGAAVQEGQGDLWVKRPNLFNWHMTQPDESILVSDGKTLWFYNPFVEQATATWLKDATGNTPFMLIARNQSSDWQQYNIKQNGDDFVLTPKASNGNLKQFTVSTKASRMHFCHILKTAPSLLLAQPLKTRRLSLIRHCFPVPVSIC